MYKGNKKGFKIVHRNIDQEMIQAFRNYGIPMGGVLMIIYTFFFFNLLHGIFMLLAVIVFGFTFLLIFLKHRKRIKESAKTNLLLFEGSNVSLVGLEIISDLFNKGYIDSEVIEKVEREIHVISSQSDAIYFKDNFSKNHSTAIIINKLYDDEVIGLIILFEYLLNVKLRLKIGGLKDYLYRKLKPAKSIQDSLDLYLSKPNTTYKTKEEVLKLLKVVDLEGQRTSEFLYDKETFKQMSSRSYGFSKGDQKVVRQFYNDYYHQVWRIFRQWKKMK